MATAKTPMHESLLKKAGDNGYPFAFEMPTNLPCSVAMQPGPSDKGKACGVDFEVKAYVANEADNANEVIEKKDTCRLMIRKIQYSPVSSNPGASIALPKPLGLEVSVG